MNIHPAPHWPSEHLLRSLDCNRTHWAKRKASRGIQLARIGNISVPARTIRGEALPLSNYQIARWA